METVESISVVKQILKGTLKALNVGNSGVTPNGILFHKIRILFSEKKKKLEIPTLQQLTRRV